MNFRNILHRSVYLPFTAMALSAAVKADSPPAEDASSATAIPIIGEAVTVETFPAEEARQGVAVDSSHFYVISNTRIGKYRKADYARVDTWHCDRGDPLIHMNAGIVFGDILYAAHSNYPEVPMTGSVEMFNTDDLTHVGTHSFGMSYGSTTWMDRRDGQFFVCFAHYGNRAAEPNRDSSWSQLVSYDRSWRRLEGWAFPPKLITQFGRYSASGGAFGPRGFLFVTGHDKKDLYVLSRPEGGSKLQLHGRIPMASPGQAFAWDPDNRHLLYSILRSESKVVVQEVRFKEDFAEQGGF